MKLWRESFLMSVSLFPVQIWQNSVLSFHCLNIFFGKFNSESSAGTTSQFANDTAITNAGGEIFVFHYGRGLMRWLPPFCNSANSQCSCGCVRLGPVPHRGISSGCLLTSFALGTDSRAQSTRLLPSLGNVFACIICHLLSIYMEAGAWSLPCLFPWCIWKELVVNNTCACPSQLIPICIALYLGIISIWIQTESTI